MKIKLLFFLLLACSCVFAQTGTPTQSTTPSQKLPPVRTTIEVTTTRLPEDPDAEPAAVQVFTGDELAMRGVRDLRGALALATGVDIAPGGDAGPASSVPEFWGLKEFDAFLLLSDGVPWGGAFNPALTTLGLTDVERIEVLRGPAPVSYGATSFVGVINVVHRDPSSKERELVLTGGSFASGGGSFSTPIPLAGDWASRLTVEGEREGFRDDRTSFRRGHGFWRVARKPTADSNRIWFNADLNWLDQDPASPQPRVGTILSPLVPIDSNQNPAGAFLNDHRGTLMGGFDSMLAGAQWSTLASFSRSNQDILRGFLVAVEDAADNAHGFREKIKLTDFYLDSHLSWKLPRSLRFLVGADYLHGTGTARGADFDYTTLIDGSLPTVVPSPDDLDFHINDHRDFFGAYSSVEWSPFERLRFDGGLRLNVTHEFQQVIDGGAGTTDQQTRNDVRPSATVGALFSLWSQGQDRVSLYANYRDTFKPAAIDFGIGESPGGDLILKPETSRSIEGGLKGNFLDRRVEVEASGFLMNFENLVVPTQVNGVPMLINAGSERFKGFESSVGFFLRQDVVARATYSFHDATFTDFLQDFDGVLTQLAGNRLEMSARHLAAFGIHYSPTRGLLGGITLNYTGSRFLDRRNRAQAEGFPTLGLSAGYRTSRWELRVDGTNLTDRRDPVAESEFGDAQYYLMPARRVDATFRVHF